MVVHPRPVAVAPAPTITGFGVHAGACAAARVLGHRGERQAPPEPSAAVPDDRASCLPSPPDQRPTGGVAEVVTPAGQYVFHHPELLASFVDPGDYLTVEQIADLRAAQADLLAELAPATSA